MAVKKQHRVWVVMHYEIMGVEPHEWVDCVQFHVSSTLAKAEGYIKRSIVDPFSWWQIHPHVVDTDDDEGAEVHYYNYKGRAIRAAPTEQAVKAYRKDRRENPSCYKC
jgi:hypothetical protein